MKTTIFSFVPKYSSLALLLFCLFIWKESHAQFHIQAGAAVTTSGNAQIVFDKIDLENNGTFEGGNSTVTILETGGSSDLNFGGSGTTALNHLIINLQSQNALLAGNASVGGNLTFTSGHFDLNGNNITLGANGTILNENETSSFTGSTGGEIIKTLVLDMPASANPGNIGIEISSASNLGSTEIRRGHMRQATPSGDGIFRYFDVTPANNTNLNATVRLYYLDAENNNPVINENDLDIWRLAGNDWDLLNKDNQDLNADWLEKNAVDHFSRWIIAETCPFQTYYADSDMDGFGDPDNPGEFCSQPANFVTDNTDCDDGDADEFPGQTWYIDADGDGYGTSSTTACERPANGFLLGELSGNGTDDCDDGDAAVNPAATEICDGVDNDCDGLLDNNDPNVEDNEPPVPDVANLPDLMGQCSVTIANTPTATDNCAGTVQGTTADPLTYNSQGTFEVTWNYDDGNGNSSSQAQTVIVDDTTPPSVACKNINIALDTNGEATIDPSDVFDSDGSTDNCGGPVTPASVSPNAFNCQNEGANNVILTANDENGNPNTCNAEVTIMAFLTITNVSVSHETCAGAGDGSIAISATANGGQVKHSIDGGSNYQAGNTFNNLTPGTYDIKVKVFGIPNVCEKTDQRTVNAGGGTQTWYKDLDEDSYSDGVTQQSCSQPAGYELPGNLLGLDNDCDDNDPLEFPEQTWYEDADGDLFGSGNSTVACERPNNHFVGTELETVSGDCDDNNADIHPGATETCNGIDDDCNGMVDDGVPGGQTFAGNVLFITQAAVDAWPACFSVIDGNVTILGAGITDLSALSNLEEITGNLTVQSTGLGSMAGLDNLTDIGGTLLIYFNSSLTTLDGLGSLASVGGNLSMYYNFTLSDCCAIYDLLNNGGVTGITIIFFNAVGCSSSAEILANCTSNPLIVDPQGNFAVTQATGFKGGRSVAQSTDLKVVPNPTNDRAFVYLNGNVSARRIKVSDVRGGIVFSENLDGTSHQVELNTMLWQKGIYSIYIELETGSFLAKRLVVID